MSAPFARSAPVRREDCVDSTNLVLRRLAAEAPDGAAVIAARQSAGRGRSGRGFLSPEGGLYLSVLRRPAVGGEALPTLTPVAAVAVCRAVERVCALRCSIKWPNDVVLGGKKICGILVESVLGGEPSCVIVGIGINVNTPPFPEELRGGAGSLADAAGGPVDLEALAAALLEELDGCYEAWLAEPGFCLDEYRSRCVTLGREVLAGGRSARAEGIGADYSLLVSYPDGTREALRFGEVSVRGLCGYA